MLTPELIELNPRFVGRAEEIRQLSELKSQEEAIMILMYGRRRVGKTELLEQVFRDRNILKFEGVENKPEDIQRQVVLNQLRRYANEPLLKNIKTDSWQEIFDLMAPYIQTGVWTLYFEETQWLADYQDEFIKYLKLAWDNQFRRNPNLVLILCGSSPSFMIKQVVRSKALYNRSQYEFHLKELKISEVSQLLPNRAFPEILDAYLTLGGIPEYLKRTQKYSSFFLGLCQESFLPNAYFSSEYERIFVSSLSSSPYYRSVIDKLSQEKFMTRTEISEYLNLPSGGRLSELLEELQYCGFIDRYVPYGVLNNSMLGRYIVSDAYLHFFFRFIQPVLDKINSGQYQTMPTQALSSQAYQQYLGYAFERFCRRHAHSIARKLGFSAVNYTAGPFYNRATEREERGYQIDLLFDRQDKVVTVCELKYRQGKIGIEVIDDFEKKLSRFETQNKKSGLIKSIHKVLIAPFGAEEGLINRHYFDQILTWEDLQDF